MSHTPEQLAAARAFVDRTYSRVTNVEHFRSLRDGSMFYARTSATTVTRQRYVRDARRQNRLLIASRKRLRELGHSV